VEEPFPALQHTSIVELQSEMASGRLTATALVQQYLARIEALDRDGPRLNAVLEVNPDALEIAAARDRERQEGTVRGPLHGIPILLKDNIDTADRMMTTAGSLALMGAAPLQDAGVAARLRASGAILLGKTSLSEWANFRSKFSSSGWCGRLGQGRNPYALDRTPSGSSSGSGIAAAAALCAAALATETDGSIVSPANANGVVGIKPSVGLVSRAGVIPISHTQDTVGVHARSVADAAAVLTALASGPADPRDPATSEAAGAGTDYTRFLDPNGLKGARIGVARNLGFDASPAVDAVMWKAIQAMEAAGAVIVDPAAIPSDLDVASEAELEVLLFEFKADLNAYLATRQDVALDREGYQRTLAGLIAFNQEHAEQELPFFGQDIFLAAEARGPLTDPAYLRALETSRRLSGSEGIDQLVRDHRLDALVAPTSGPARPIDLINGDARSPGSSSVAARVGYPIVSIPIGFIGGMPMNLSFFGPRFSEPMLIRLAFALEQLTLARQPPRYLPSLPAW
jgi:amidase